jgi:hypothetical protein
MFYSYAPKKGIQGLVLATPNLIELSISCDQIIVQQDFESHENKRKLLICGATNISK